MSVIDQDLHRMAQELSHQRVEFKDEDVVFKVITIGDPGKY